MRETQSAMARQSLLELFQVDSRPAHEIAVAWRRGYRMARWSYGTLLRVATQFAQEMEERGIAKGDRVLIWGENCGEWVAAFLGCIFCGAIAVPMDAIAAPDFAQRVVAQAGVRLAVLGRGLQLHDPALPTMVLEDLSEAVSGHSSELFLRDAAGRQAPGRNDPIEIVFTSGTTAEPRGVVLTHANLLANLEPVEKEIEHYRRYERIFHPLRFLDLLPLSHVFGQLLGIFLPQILGGTAIFQDTLNPAEVMRTIREERVSVLVTVPRLIESLRDHIERELEARGKLDGFRRDFEKGEGEHFLKRWWRFRAIHRQFGWKFWAVISGGAALPAAAEQFWGRLGYAVVQGYGLTETTSLVSVNHPFRLARGSIGKTLPGLELKLSDEGEILVRGENVAAGYWKDAQVAPLLNADGWFHTGDLGERDASGTLYFKGRRKNVIVTPEGLNIYPEDLEAELRKESEVRDCVVIGLAVEGNAQACAVLLLRNARAEDAAAREKSAAAIVVRANARLAPFQQMRRWMVWPDEDFPRTPTQKPMLGKIREFAEAEFRGAGAKGAAPSPLNELLARIGQSGAGKTDAAKMGNDMDAEALQLSSIERVELLSALEDRYQVDLSETKFSEAGSAADLKRLVEQPAAQNRLYHYPRWAQTWPMRVLRTAAYYLLARPAMLLLGWPRVQGRENLRGVNGPVLLIANHISYIDPSYVLAALPWRLRRRVAVAMEGEILEGMRKPPAGTGIFSAAIDWIGYWLVIAFFNVFPLPQRAGFRKSFAFAGELVDRGWSVLVFPEGARTVDGEMAPFRAGIGLLAMRLGLPVVPMRIEGLYELKRAGKKWARPGEIRVTIGAPVRFGEEEAAEKIAGELQQQVGLLGENRG